MDKMYTVMEVAEIFHVNRRSVYNWLKDNKLHAVKIGKAWLISEEELKRFASVGTRVKTESPLNGD